jgi:hypothetical protein
MLQVPDASHAEALIEGRWSGVAPLCNDSTWMSQVSVQDCILLPLRHFIHTSTVVRCPVPPCAKRRFVQLAPWLADQRHVFACQRHLEKLAAPATQRLSA